MLPTTVLLALRRRTVLRRAFSLAGYVGGAVTLVLGGVLFHVDAAMSEMSMRSGFVMTAGIMAMVGTHELRQAIHGADRTPDPIEC